MSFSIIYWEVNILTSMICSAGCFLVLLVLQIKYERLQFYEYGAAYFDFNNINDSILLVISLVILSLRAVIYSKLDAADPKLPSEINI